MDLRARRGEANESTWEAGRWFLQEESKRQKIVFLPVTPTTVPVWAKGRQALECESKRDDW